MRKAQTRYQSSAPRYLPRARERETHGHVSREAGAAGGGADAGGRSVRGRWCGRQAEALALVRAAGGGAPRLGRADQPRLAGHDRQAVGEVAAHCGGLVDRHWRHRHRAIGAAPEEERGPKWVVLARHDAVDLVAARAAPRQHLAPALAVGLDAHLVAREQQVRRRLEVAVRPLAAWQQPLGARRVVHLLDLLEHGGVLLRLLGHRARLREEARLDLAPDVAAALPLLGRREPARAELGRREQLLLLARRLLLSHRHGRAPAEVELQPPALASAVLGVQRAELEQHRLLVGGEDGGPPAGGEVDRGRDAPPVGLARLTHHQLGDLRRRQQPLVVLEQAGARDAVPRDDRVHLDAVGRLEVVLDERVAHLVVAPAARRLRRARQLEAGPIERRPREARRQLPGDVREDRLLGAGDRGELGIEGARVYLLQVDGLVRRRALVGDDQLLVGVLHGVCAA